MPYKVGIIGLGISSIFALRRLNELGIKDIACFEQGKQLKRRFCRHDCGSCGYCSHTSGIGGAGLFSDGTFYKSEYFGGQTNKRVRAAMNKVWKTIKEHGATPKHEIFKQMRKSFEDAAGLRFKACPLLWLGSDRGPEFIESLLSETTTTIFNHRVLDFTRQSSHYELNTDEADRCNVDYLIVGTGQMSQDWLYNISRNLRIKSIPNPCSIGIRIEKSHFSPLQSGITDGIWRTFCACPQGYVVRVDKGYCVGVNGHSTWYGRSGQSNIALMTYVYPSTLSKIFDLLNGNTPMVQRLVDFAYTRMPSKTPGSVKPTLESAHFGYDIGRHMMPGMRQTLITFLKKLIPYDSSLYAPDNLIYYPEIKYFPHRFTLTENFEARTNLFFVGDVTGSVYALFKSAVSGYIAGEEIAKRINKNS